MTEPYDFYELVIELPKDVRTKLADDAEANDHSIGKEILRQLERAADLEAVVQMHDQFMEKLVRTLREAALTARRHDLEAANMATRIQITFEKIDRSSVH